MHSNFYEPTPKKIVFYDYEIGYVTPQNTFLISELQIARYFFAYIKGICIH